MKKRLIDANRLVCEVESNAHLPGCIKSKAISAVENAPTVDAAEVVRCKDCEYWPNGITEKRPCHKTGAYPMSGNDFCSYGKREGNKND